MYIYCVHTSHKTCMLRTHLYLAFRATESGWLGGIQTTIRFTCNNCQRLSVQFTQLLYKPCTFCMDFFQIFRKFDWEFTWTEFSLDGHIEKLIFLTSLQETCINAFLVTLCPGKGCCMQDGTLLHCRAFQEKDNLRRQLSVMPQKNFAPQLKKSLFRTFTFSRVLPACTFGHMQPMFVRIE